MTSLDYKLARDQDFIKHQLRIPTDGKGFWIGKKSLSQWKRLARDDLEEQIVKEAREANYDTFELWVSYQFFIDVHCTKKKTF